MGVDQRQQTLMRHADAAMYAARSKDVSADTRDGSNDDGEAKEADQIRTTVESVTTGSGADNINSADGKTGAAVCGRGIDSVLADRADKVAKDCERVTRKDTTNRKAPANHSRGFLFPVPAGA